MGKATSLPASNGTPHTSSGANNASREAAPSPPLVRVSLRCSVLLLVFVCGLGMGGVAQRRLRALSPPPVSSLVLVRTQGGLYEFDPTTGIPHYPGNHYRHRRVVVSRLYLWFSRLYCVPTHPHTHTHTLTHSHSHTHTHTHTLTHKHLHSTTHKHKHKHKHALTHTHTPNTHSHILTFVSVSPLTTTEE